MSADEQRQQEAKSSFKIATTAAGKPLVEIKLYDGCTSEEANRLRMLSVDQYKQTPAALGVPV